MDTLIDALAPLLLIVVAGTYAKRAHTLAVRGAPVSVWRQLSFGFGIVLLLGADVPPLSTVAEELVVAHMVQHLMIGDLAGLFVALGLTGPILQPVLAHRIMLSPEAVLRGEGVEDVLERVTNRVKAPLGVKDVPPPMPVSPVAANGRTNGNGARRAPRRTRSASA